MENENKNEPENDRKVLISSKVPPELEERLKTMAAEERRTVSNMVHLLLETHPRMQSSAINTAN